MRNFLRGVGAKFRPVVVVAAALGFAATHVVGATPAEINDAIERGKALLYSLQNNGNWETVTRRKPGIETPNDTEGLQWGGMTALATFALLACGDSPQSNEKLKKAVAFLEKADLRGTYAIGVRAQVWNLVPEDDAVKKARHRDKELLEEGVRMVGGPPRSSGDEVGFFGYGEGIDKRQYDHSISQFGVLGLWSLQQAGEDIDLKYWKLFDRAWRNQRQRDGAWCYLDKPIEEPTNSGLGGELISMTAAGVATLFITQDYTNATAKCEGNPKDPDIEAGMQWLGQNLSAIDANDWSQRWRYYTMFGIARIGLASGYKYIGTTDWFKWGADQLINEQSPDNGAWRDNPRDTAFSLLFLARGRAPIVFNKLQYNLLGASKKTVEGNWNQRPRDVANLTRYIGKQTESELNWQIVNLKEKASDLLDAPLLYMSGNQPLKLTPDDENKLRDYVDQGGIIVGHADLGSTAFSDTFRKMGERMFPGQTFKPLPADHPIYRDENFQAKNWTPAPRVEALDNGVRAQMILLPTGDPAADWQSQKMPKIGKYPVGQLMTNIYLYCTDKAGLRVKGDTYIVKRKAGIEAERTAAVARLKYAGNWNPEPGGWNRVANLLHNHKKLDLTISDVEPGKGLLGNQYKFADLTGTASFTLTEPMRAEIRKYVEGGGTLLVDAAGGRSAFSAAAQTELGKIFPAIPQPLPVLPLSSPIYNIGDPVREVGYRRFAKLNLGNLKVPQVRGSEVNHRLAVFFSAEDLAEGLVGQQVDGVIGYEPASATRLVENMILYSLK